MLNYAKHMLRIIDLSSKFIMGDGEKGVTTLTKTERIKTIIYKCEG